MPTLGAVGLSYWVASLPLTAGMPFAQRPNAQLPGGASDAGPSIAEQAQHLAPAPEVLTMRSKGEDRMPGLAKQSNGAAEQAQPLGTSTGDLLASEGVAAAISTERQRQLQDLTVCIMWCCQ